ncbi:mechanosensitive ion channel domain-containing protein [Nitrososphaera viennensis]|uniref:Mechanosensitive ion channel family protein n=2 Tax=Nitrososphaera viennensis TaxID=1034015 RepID=A0A977NL00_9ARCH|nr:mechanosensitive ion channel family protein [Nitrososphaera viennensis]AIC16269.1 putative small-conductance mechanosensitive ion channel protein [Nitrososphaera viennensis EN76]UVS68208.1 mechanosensitive ion channel family protein [Nitrososphaera viennensis]
MVVSSQDAVRQVSSSASAVRQVTRLVLITLLITGATWLGLYLFEQLLAPDLGIGQFHMQLTGSAITAAISFVLIYAVRRIVHRNIARINPHFSTILSFFVIIIISLIAAVVLMHQWGINPQVILVSGGLTAVITGIALSAIMGNILAGGLVLTAFPARVSDHVFMVGDNIHGVINDVRLMYTKIITDEGMEYYIPNNAIVQGSVRIVKERPLKHLLPIIEGEHIQVIASTADRYTGTVSRITPKFFILASDDDANKEIVLANANLMSGQYVIIKDRAGKK